MKVERLCPPVIVHTDLGKLNRSTLKSINRDTEVLKGIHQYLKSSLSEYELWFPAFNYSYAKSRKFDVANDPVQVGALNDSLRFSKEYLRSHVPIFSFLRERTHTPAYFSSRVNPFSDFGEYGEFQERGGLIILFGASIEALTFIHRAEAVFDIPYRYEKEFPGQVIVDGTEKDVTLQYLVRPLDYSLEYDWQKIGSLLEKNFIPIEINSLKGYVVYHSQTLMSFMLEMYIEDPFWTLKEDTKKLVEMKLEKLGRRFQLTDFELGSGIA